MQGGRGRRVRQRFPDTGQRLTAGWALQRWFWAIYGSTTPTEVLQTAVAKAPARGGGQALPGGLRP